MEKWIWIVIVFVPVWFLAAVFEPFSFSSATKYSIYESDSVGPITWRHSTFKFDGQFVIEKSRDGAKKYENCAVYNKDNWTCTFHDFSGDFGFVEGKYQDTFSNPNVRYVSRLTYILLNVKELANGGFISWLLIPVVPFFL